MKKFLWDGRLSSGHVRACPHHMRLARPAQELHSLMTLLFTWPRHQRQKAMDPWKRCGPTGTLSCPSGTKPGPKPSPVVLGTTARGGHEKYRHLLVSVLGLKPTSSTQPVDFTGLNRAGLAAGKAAACPRRDRCHPLWSGDIPH